MADDAHEPDPLGWMAVPDQHPVLASDGTVGGYVAARLGDLNNGRFDGFVLGIDVPKQIDPRLMLEAEHVQDITVDAVHTDLTGAELAALPSYEPDRASSAASADVAAGSVAAAALMVDDPDLDLVRVVTVALGAAIDALGNHQQRAGLLVEYRLGVGDGCDGSSHAFIVPRPSGVGRFSNHVA